MIIEQLITAKLDELENFFQRAKERAPNESDQETANYGLQKTLSMKEVLNRHKNRPKNIHLKQIYSVFFSVTRGVEGFDDEEINKEYRKATNGIYQIQDQLEKVIKW